MKHLLAAEPPSAGRHNGDVACWQAREPREKNRLSLAIWLSPGDWFYIHLVIGSSPTRRYNHPTRSFTFLQTS